MWLQFFLVNSTDNLYSMQSNAAFSLGGFMTKAKTNNFKTAKPSYFASLSGFMGLTL